MKITGPNGLVIDIRESIATGLVGDGSRGYSVVPEEEAPEETPVSRGPGRPRKTPQT